MQELGWPELVWPLMVDLKILFRLNVMPSVALLYWACRSRSISKKGTCSLALPVPRACPVQPGCGEGSALYRWHGPTDSPRYGTFTPTKALHWGRPPMFGDGAGDLQSLFRRRLAACSDLEMLIDG